MTSTPRGFAFLYVIIIIGAVMVSLALAASTSGAFAGGRIRSYQTSAEARTLMMRCAETVLMQIRNNTALTGSGTIGTGVNASCTYTITGATVPKTLTVVAVDETITKRVTITITQVTPVIAARWIENQ